MQPLKTKKALIISTNGRSPEIEKAFEDLVDKKLILVSIWGKDCTLLEEILDEIFVGDASVDREHLNTTSHPGESLKDVKNFVSTFESDDLGNDFDVLEF